jgi:hypothetical protein
MSRFMQKWIAIIALALMPAVSIANICATGNDLAKLGSSLATVAEAGVAPCEAGFCPYANLCDLAQAVFVVHMTIAVNLDLCSDRVADTLQISIPAEPEPPLKPPVV